MRPRLFIVLCGTGALGIAFLLARIADVSAPRRELPVYGTLTGGFTATERSGQPISTTSWRGKVCVVSYLYTVCHHGCAAILAEMKQLKETHGSRPDFQIISMAAVPGHDTPEFFHSYAEAIGVKPADPWSFVSGDSDSIGRFMSQQLKLEPAALIPEDERLNPLETHQHDLRIVLIDRHQRVRGYYSVIHPQREIAELMRERLRADTTTLLNEP